MINTVMLKPRNVITITLITALTHWVARPLYAKVARKDAE